MEIKFITLERENEEMPHITNKVVPKLTEKKAKLFRIDDQRIQIDDNFQR